MSVVESAGDDPVLKWRLDDPTDPSEMTVYDPRADDQTTAWITVTVGDTVAIEDAL